MTGIGVPQYRCLDTSQSFILYYDHVKGHICTSIRYLDVVLCKLVMTDGFHILVCKPGYQINVHSVAKLGVLVYKLWEPEYSTSPNFMQRVIGDVDGDAHVCILRQGRIQPSKDAMQLLGPLIALFQVVCMRVRLDSVPVS